MAIIGRGDIAKAIQDREGFIFYCNGVSNRLPLDEASEMKEHAEIWKLGDNKERKMMVYISTLSIYYSDSAYTKHKKRMEALIKRRFFNYCILRIGNITWGNNPNTLLNYLKSNPEAIREDTFRYLINEEELNHWIGMIPQTGKHEMNITGKRINVKEL